MNQKYIISAIIAVLVIAGVVFYTNSSAPVSPASQNAPANETQGTAPVVNTLVSATTSVKNTAVKTATASVASITNAVLASTITKTATSVQSGKAVTTFTPTEQNIYAVLSLKNATTRTQLSYVRKFNGKYVDSKVSHPLKTGDKQFYFGWTLKAGQVRNIGIYSISFYIDGKKAQTISYTVR